jgi:hypothetical protein
MRTDDENSNGRAKQPTNSINAADKETIAQLETICK